jgi:hypothetical protein
MRIFIYFCDVIQKNDVKSEAMKENYIETPAIRTGTRPSGYSLFFILQRKIVTLQRNRKDLW